ncbi:MAG: Transcriptional regulator, GntR family [uncultured Solirubrobacteraceae bacterium]|uniref:Transcriptional regulator, GntR family n=1 Tax=uncultured Solirubrobacteraceae bacterium TaxID=1162706 RepID=A0A6J4SYP1_9ACTN|nr:MAG: Transcriptional regulator, GntR family [uncultured Solirubrobacteraceae bacterium]
MDTDPAPRLQEDPYPSRKFTIKGLTGCDSLTCQMPVPENRATIARHLLRDDAYDALRAAIVSGELEPGEQLHDVELCQWLGLSRTPVREALARLGEERLVEVAPQRHTRVAPLVAQDARDAFPVLASVHALAAELAVPRIGREHVEHMRKLNREFARALSEGRAEAAYSADDDFHAIFVTFCQNAEITRIVERIAPRLRRLELLRRGVLPGRRSVAQHEAIIMRASQGDAVKTASAVRENWLEFGGLVERSLR